MHATREPAGPERPGDFETAVRAPCRVRHFRDETVPREDIDRMVDLALCATTACDIQRWRFIAVQDPALIAAMQQAVLERFEELAMKPGLALKEQKRMVARAQALMFSKAPLFMAVVTLPFVSPMEELLREAGMTSAELDRLCVYPELQSAGAAVQLLTTSAHTLGYATCWTCAPLVDGERLQQLLGVEPPARLVAMVAVGRPGELPEAGRRLPLETVLTVR
jgi:nitroreductase